MAYCNIASSTTTQSPLFQVLTYVIPTCINTVDKTFDSPLKEERKQMSDIVSEVQLEEELRGLHAAGNYQAMVKLAEGYRSRLNARNLPCHFEDPATTYQYMIALSRTGRLEEALAIRWRDMAGWSGFTPEKLGDWYRDGHARFFLARKDTLAAKGAVGEAMKLHRTRRLPSTLLDQQVPGRLRPRLFREPTYRLTLERIQAIVAES